MISAYVYFLVREAGHLAAILLAGVPAEFMIRYRVIPAIEISPESQGIGNSTEGFIMMSGPVMALLAGYLLFVLINRYGRLVQSALGPILGFTCYLTLMLDPIYYSVIPLAGLGGEPERLAYLLDISTGGIAGGAFALLVLNIILIRLRLVPLIRRPQDHKAPGPHYPDTTSS
jgi:hypothetical protein